MDGHQTRTSETQAKTFACSKRTRPESVDDARRSSAADGREAGSGPVVVPSPAFLIHVRSLSYVSIKTKDDGKLLISFCRFLPGNKKKKQLDTSRF